MSQLMTISEMRERYQKKEDSFDLTLEKWVRIRQFLDTSLTLIDFKKLLDAVAMPIPFCYEYQINDCLGCPLERTCARGKGERFAKVMRIIQAYVLAGDMLPREPLISEIDYFLTELEMVKAKTKGMVH